MKLTKRKLRSLLKDWFVRDGKTFVHASKLHRAGWEDTLLKGSSYSSYLMEAPTVKDLFKRSFSIARETLTAMILPVRPVLRVGSQPDSYTDGTTVTLSTSYFEDKDLTPGEKLDIFIGLTIHEGAHVKYTEFDILNANSKLLSNKAIAFLQNLIEDERIEYNVGEDTPGFSRFIEKVKLYYFNTKFKAEFKGWKTLRPFQKILLSLLRIVRYPTELSEEDFELLSPYLLEIKKVLVPYPKDTEEVLQAAVRIYEIIKDLAVEEDLKDTDPTEEEIKKALEQIDADVKAGKYDDLFKLLTILVKTADISGKTTPDDADTATFIKEDPRLIAEIMGSVERPSADLIIIKEAINKYAYLKAFVEVKPYVNSIASKLKGHSRGYKYIHKSLRTGLLDTTKLAEAVQGVPTVYTRYGEVRTDKVCVCLVVDESGSMGSSGMAGTSIEAARKTAILLVEALRLVKNVQLFVYGHSADREISGTELYVYYEPGFTNPHTLGSIRARSNNRDGHAIFAASQRVRKFSKENCLMFVISDGEPAAMGYSGTPAVKHTRSVVQSLQKKNFQIMQVAINHTYDPKDMFDHYVVLENMKTLAQDLGKVVEKAVEKFTAIKVD